MERLFPIWALRRSFLGSNPDRRWLMSIYQESGFSSPEEPEAVESTIREKKISESAARYLVHECRVSAIQCLCNLHQGRNHFTYILPLHDIGFYMALL